MASGLRPDSCSAGPTTSSMSTLADRRAAGPCAQDAGVARLDELRRHVDGDVGPGLETRADDTDRPAPFLQDQPAGKLADRAAARVGGHVGEGEKLAGHGVQAVRAEQRAGPRRPAAGPRRARRRRPRRWRRSPEPRVRRAGPRWPAARHPADPPAHRPGLPDAPCAAWRGGLDGRVRRALVRARRRPGRSRAPGAGRGAIKHGHGPLGMRIYGRAGTCGQVSTGARLRAAAWP